MLHKPKKARPPVTLRVGAFVFGRIRSGLYMVMNADRWIGTIQKTKRGGVKLEAYSATDLLLLQSAAEDFARSPLAV